MRISPTETLAREPRDAPCLAPVTTRKLWRLCVALLGSPGVLAGQASALTPSRADPQGWTPALAAVGDTVARSDQQREGSALLVVPALVGAGMNASASLADPNAAAAVDAPPPAARDETERWVPSFAFTSGVLGQGADGSVDSDSTVTYRYFGQATASAVPSFVQACTSPLPPCTAPAMLRPFDAVITRSLREGKGEVQTFQVVLPPANGFLITGVTPAAAVLPASGSDVFLSPFVGASLELMTPGAQPLPGRPRAFVHGDSSLAFAFDRPVALASVPNDVVFPTPRPVNTEILVKGVGARTSGEVQTLLLSGGIGAAFTVDAWERRLRIKPSFEYMREEIQVSGRLTRGFRKDTGLFRNQNFGRPPGGPGNTGPVDQPALFLAPINIEAEETKPFHGIGPGLELEMDAARAGPLMLSVFLTGRAYKMLGDLALDIEGSDTITDPALVGGTQTVSAQFKFNIHSWSYLGGLGLRFRWLPED